MYFVNKQDRGVCAAEKGISFGFVDNIPHVFHARADGAECVKRRFQFVCDYFCKRRLPDAGRPPEDKRRYAPGFYHPAQNRLLAYKVLLPDVIVERPGS
jgi:hypothetical protein